MAESPQWKLQFNYGVTAVLATIPFVTVLFCAGRPPTIVLAIVTVIVDSFKRHPLGFLSHISIKAGE
jgi:hypothetical protein